MKQPKVIYNNWIPIKGFALINIFGIIFIRKGKILRDWRVNHELIHTQQMKELWYIFFYILYPLEYVFRLFQYKFKPHTAYRNISFEREAYANQKDFDYLDHRKKYDIKKYISLKQLAARQKSFEYTIKWFLNNLQFGDENSPHIDIELKHTSEKFVQITFSNAYWSHAVLVKVFSSADLFSEKWEYKYKDIVIGMSNSYRKDL